MNLEMKYIMTRKSPVIFSELLLHSDVATGLSDIVSAGFVTISWNPTTGFKCGTYGESISLSLYSRIEDGEKISQMLNQQKI